VLLSGKPARAETFYGILAGGTALPTLPSIGTAFGTSRGVSLATDYVSQVGGNFLAGKRGLDAFTNVNITSLALSTINPTSTWGGLLANNFVANTWSVSATEGFNGLGAGKDLTTVLLQTGLSTLAGKLTSRLDLSATKIQIRLNHLEGIQGRTSPLYLSLQSQINSLKARATLINLTTGVPSSGLNSGMENKKVP